MMGKLSVIGKVHIKDIKTLTLIPSVSGMPLQTVR